MKISSERDTGHSIREDKSGRVYPPAGSSPLTGLPGNRTINKRLKDAAGNTGMAVIYVDITDFKPYNEVYGFSAGDNVILSVAGLLKEGAAKYGSKDTFVGHIGGDDFIITAEGKYIKKIFSFLDREFLNIRDGFYSGQDLSRGNIVAFSRAGYREEFPLMGLCSAAFLPAEEKLLTPESISEFATHLKDSAKSLREKDNIFVTPENINILSRPLKDYCRDEDIQLHRRRAAIEAMGESGLAHYGRAMVELLDELPAGKSDNKNVMFIKKSILFSLGRLRYKPAEDIIVKYTRSFNPHLRTRAVEALGNLGYTRHLDRIGEMINDKNIYTAVMAVKSLGKIGHPGGLRYFKDVRENSSKWLNAETAVARARLKNKESLKLLERFIRASNPVYRRKAARAMSFLNDYRSLEYLLQAIKKETDYNVKKIMAESFGRIAANLDKQEFKKAEKSVYPAYKKLPDSLNHNILPALGRLEGSKFYKILTRAVRKGNERQKFAALTGLGRQCAKAGIEILKYSYREGSAPVRTSAIESLGHLKGPGTLEFLRQALKDRDKPVRGAASAAVLKIIRDDRG